MNLHKKSYQKCINKMYTYTIYTKGHRRAKSVQNVHSNIKHSTKWTDRKTQTHARTNTMERLKSRTADSATYMCDMCIVVVL